MIAWLDVVSLRKKATTEDFGVSSRSLIVVAILAMGVVRSNLAAAVEPQYSGQYNRCIQAAGGSETKMMECSYAEAQIWDRRLNAAYQKTMTKLPQEDQGKLRNVQRLWVQYRDAWCSYVNSGGLRGRTDQAQCILDTTARRAVELE
jgi:uncharacterized protein YecT (DUF1311 family)